MDAALLSALVALAMLLGAVAGLLWRGGRREGTVDQILKDLSRIVANHEERISRQEARRR